MKSLFKLLGYLTGICLCLIVLSCTFSIIKKTWFSKSSHKNGYVAVIDVDGVIYDARSKVKDINEILENSEAKALIVRVNSPGGLVGPSQELYQALRMADQKIPVVVSMGSLAASGGYYTALGGRKIFSNPGTLTASIGVIMEFAQTDKLYKWAKVERFTLKAGKFKDIGSSLRPMTTEEKNLLQTMMNDIHGQFRQTVMERRKISQEVLDETADGRIMTGSQAKEAGLVDELGGFEEAAKEAKKLAKLPADAAIEYPDSKEGLLKKVLFGDTSESSSITEIISQFRVGLAPQQARLWMLAPIY